MKNSNRSHTMTPQDITTAWQQKKVAEYFEPANAYNPWWHLAPEARVFAIELHKNQKRKDSELAYSTHLGEVALIVSLFNGMGLLNSEEAATATAAAWLHDSIEDQGQTRADIEAKFGIKVANIVDALSKRPKSDELHDPMADSLARINNAGRIASLVKVADRISNLSTAPPLSWQIKNIKKYGLEAKTIIATLSDNLPQQVCLIMESIATDYLKMYYFRSGPSM